MEMPNWVVQMDDLSVLVKVTEARIVAAWLCWLC